MDLFLCICGGVDVMKSLFWKEIDIDRILATISFDCASLLDPNRYPGIPHPIPSKFNSPCNLLPSPTQSAGFS